MRSILVIQMAVVPTGWGYNGEVIWWLVEIFDDVLGYVG